VHDSSAARIATCSLPSHRWISRCWIFYHSCKSVENIWLRKSPPNFKIWSADVRITLKFGFSVKFAAFTKIAEQFYIKTTYIIAPGLKSLLQASNAMPHPVA